VQVKRLWLYAQVCTLYGIPTEGELIEEDIEEYTFYTDELDEWMEENND
jgi:hypothetical protein